MFAFACGRLSSTLVITCPTFCRSVGEVQLWLPTFSRFLFPPVGDTWKQWIEEMWNWTYFFVPPSSNSDFLNDQRTLRTTRSILPSHCGRPHFTLRLTRAIFWKSVGRYNFDCLPLGFFYFYELKARENLPSPRWRVNTGNERINVCALPSTLLLTRVVRWKTVKEDATLVAYLQAFFVSFLLPSAGFWYSWGRGDGENHWLYVCLHIVVVHFPLGF